jgi:hypothetical protein
MSPGRRNRAAGLPDIFWPMALLALLALLA